MERFYSFFDALTSDLSGAELLTAHLKSEQSNFIRFNHGRVRQPGSVTQMDCTVRLVNGKRQAQMQVSLTGDVNADIARGRQAVSRLREWVSHLPDDPYLCLPPSVSSTHRETSSQLPAPEQMVEDVLTSATGQDLVGIMATGTITRAFASSSGQRNWFSSHPYSFDWSLYHHGDKAVKSTMSGFEWSPAALNQKMEQGKERLAILGQPTKTVSPGKYRVYLSPTAMNSVLSMCCWGGFSARATKIGMSPLLLLSTGEKRFDPRVNICDHLAAGAAETFQENGFTRPDRVPLIESGAAVGYLISPRTATEYDMTTNGAGDGEHPCALEMAGGNLDATRAMEELGTGIFVSNLWYLNFSDRPAGRITGMTRFATLWVENGRPVAPVDPMRFDETLYKALGDNLVDLTSHSEFELSTSTYHRRSTDSSRVPGALIDDFTFTL